VLPPVLLALDERAAPAGASEVFPSIGSLTALLASHGVGFCFIAPNLAHDQGRAVVVCDRCEGWQDRVTRIEAAGAVAVLLGAPPGPSEQRHLLAPGLETGSTPMGLLAAIWHAQGRLQARDEPGREGQALLERAQSAEQVIRFAQTIAGQFAVPQIVKVAIVKTRELCDAEGASLLLVDHETGDLYFDSVAGAGLGRIERVRLKVGVGIAGKVALRAQGLLVPDVRACPDFDTEADKTSGFRTGSVIAVPLVIGGDVLGVLEAVRSVENLPFAAAHLRRLEDLAPHVAIAVHNAQITGELRQIQAEVLSANAGLEKKVQERTEMISKAKREWERTFDAISEPISLQHGYVVRRVNSAYAARVGMPITRIPGKTCYQLLAGRASPCPGCPLARGRQGELTGELAISGSAILRFSGYWMNEDPADSTVVVHYQDVTHQKVLQERLRESERLAAVGQLASGAAHEINNPLGFLTSNLRSLRTAFEDLQPATQQLARGLKGPEVDEVTRVLEDGLDMIDESLEGARRVADIVKGLRELSRLEIGRLEPCGVNDSVTRALRAEFGDASTRVTATLEATSTASIPPLQLDQVIGHILRNARQAVTGEQRVHVRTVSDEREVRIEVRDEGPGIAKENLRRIFEPFFTTRGVGKGIGLGLTAAYGIVNRVGGEIDVVSEVGAGATFIVRLPRSTQAPRAATVLVDHGTGLPMPDEAPSLHS
jgi:two-component system NtrC family sensor kinase